MPGGPHGQQGSKSSPAHPSADPWVGGGEGRAASEQLTISLREKTENYLKGSFKSSGLNELNTRLVIQLLFSLLINRCVVVNNISYK